MTKSVTPVQSQIRSLAEANHETVVGHRRFFHQFPELSFEEKETSAYICRFLEQLRVPYKSGYAGYGIVAELTGADPDGKVIALRADMDALPIEEETGLPFSSRHTGKMHACGHDIHMASLMGTLLILEAIKEQWNGKVLFVFQPGEEQVPGGAKIMLGEGALAQQPPDLILGQHVSPEIPAGRLGFRPGKYMASGDEIYLEIKGKGGHAASPGDVIDPVLISAEVLIRLREMIRKESPDDHPSLLAFGKISGMGATNVIPGSVKLEGTFRTLDEKWRRKAHQLIRKELQAITARYGAGFELEVREGYPVLENHPGLTEQAMGFASELWGPERISRLDIRMGAEDFAYFAQQYPAVFYRLGTGFPDKPATGLHSPSFVANEEALLVGCASMAWLAFRFLQE